MAPAALVGGRLFDGARAQAMEGAARDEVRAVGVELEVWVAGVAIPMGLVESGPPWTLTKTLVAGS